MISSQKDTLLKHLRDVINDQNEVIQKLETKQICSKIFIFSATVVLNF